MTSNPDATLDEIGRACGISPSCPAVGAGKIVRNPSVQQRFAEAMDKRPKLFDEALLIKLEEGLESKRTDRLISQRTGEVSEFVDDDMPTRKSYLELAVKLKGALKQSVEHSGPDGGPIPVAGALPPAILSMTKEELAKFVKDTK